MGLIVMKVRMKEVAKTAGVSTATVSYVINKTRFVSEEKKQKVLQAMEQLGYTPNSAARSLRSKKSYTIGLIVPDINNFFFTGIIEGIEQVVQSNGYQLILSNSNEDFTNEKEQINRFNSQLIDGLIMAPTADDHSFLCGTLGEYPVVYIDRKPNGCFGESVLVNNSEVVYEAITYLIKAGHEKIGILTGIKDLTTTRERLAGYQKAFSDYGLQLDNSLIKTGDSRYKSGYELTKEVLNNKDITALFVANNLMTIGSMEFLREKKINLPGELAFIGFDDYKWSSIIIPRLSVIKQPTAEMGRKAAEILLKRIKEEEQNNYSKEYRLTAKFYLRDSC